MVSRLWTLTAATAITVASSTLAFADNRSAIADAARAALATWAQTWKFTESWAEVYRDPTDEWECVWPTIIVDWKTTYLEPKNPRCNVWEEDRDSDTQDRELDLKHIFPETPDPKILTPEEEEFKRLLKNKIMRILNEAKQWE